MGVQNIDNLASKILALESQLERLQWRFKCPKCGHSNRSGAIGDLLPREVILYFLKQFDRPIGLRLLKRKILESGYPIEKFGPRQKYFYTLIGRLVKARIVMRVDGDEIMMAG